MKTLDSTGLDHLFSAVLKTYRIDLENYAQASLERRIERFLNIYPHAGLKELTARLIGDARFFDVFITEITVNTTEMFRDPDCWKLLREQVIPGLQDLPGIRIWHAGCSSGEEIVSMAILLKELGLLDKCSIVASDINKEILEKAKTARYSLKTLPLNQDNYIKAGGSADLSDYYTTSGSDYNINPDLLSKVRFMRHDLSGGPAFSKFDLIMCRNVLIYFNKTLQDAVFSLFRQSLFKKGFVAIGKKESMTHFSEYAQFDEFNYAEKIYRLK